MSRSITISNSRILESKTTRGLFSPDVTAQVSSSADLLFPTATNKPYYQVGDMILTAELDGRRLSQMYEEFEGESEFSWGRFLLYAMDADKVVVAKRIEAIQGEGMNARITLRPLMKVSDKEWVQLTTLRGEHLDVQSTGQLMESFLFADLHDSLKIWLPISKGVVEVITLPMGGAVRSGATRIGTALFRKFGPKVVKRILSWGGKKLASTAARKAASTAAKIATGVAKDTTRTIVAKYYEQLRIDKVTGTNELDAKLPEIIQRALRDAFADNVTKVLIDEIEKCVPGCGADELLTKSIKDRITIYLTQKVLKNGLAPCTIFIKSALRSIPVGDKETYAKNLGAQLNKEFTAWLSPATLTAHLEEGFKEIVDRPELVISWD
jgi:hypothetical protein